ncbi:hypothetical protein WJX77_000636 [Trebouxia sp. C0004]
MERLTRQLLQNIDLTPNDSVQVPPSGLCSIAKPGDHIARKVADEPYWHHGIMGKQGKTPGSFVVIGNFPHGDGERNIQSRSLEEFLDGADEARVIPWTAVDEDHNDVTEEGRKLALRTAKSYAKAKQQVPFDLLLHNCEAFATMCWTGEQDRYQAVTSWLETLTVSPRKQRGSKLQAPCAGLDLNKWKRSSK